MKSFTSETLSRQRMRLTDRFLAGMSEDEWIDDDLTVIPRS